MSPEAGAIAFVVVVGFSCLVWASLYAFRSLD